MQPSYARGSGSFDNSDTQMWLEYVMYYIDL